MQSGFTALAALSAVVLAGTCSVAQHQASTSTPLSAPVLINGYEPKWWKEAVVYQIYPRSFQDSNGDGIGDLQGIRSRLDYLEKLGVTVIWMSPHYDSPNVDNGYDIRDYRKVMTEFGTMSDFDALLSDIKKRHMRLILDLVVNHTSDEHQWFVESQKSKHNPYRDFYIWRPGRIGSDGTKRPPNNYPSAFSGSAWQYDPKTDEYYLHIFAVKQPDLNWDNPSVRQEIYKLMRFWLDKGVDGFRMDVITFISKQPGLPDLTAQQLKDPAAAFAGGPHLHEYLQEMNREVLSKYDVLTVGEATGLALKQAPDLVDDQRHELNEVFTFERIGVRQPGLPYPIFPLSRLREKYASHAQVMGKHDWDTVFLSNHDGARLVSRLGDPSDKFRAASAKLLETLLLTMCGTPYIYQGDELGMTNYPFQSIREFEDIQAQNRYKEQVLQRHAMTEGDYLEFLRHTSRDNARTPMQWDSSANAGFTTGPKPWLAVNPNFTKINAAAEVNDPDSVYNYTAQIIALRKRTPALIYGDYADIDREQKQIFAYLRTLGHDQYLIVHNFSSQPAEYSLPKGLVARSLVVDNYPGKESGISTLHLMGWESRIYKQ